MSHIKDCKDCITYAICRSGLIERISRSVEHQDKKFNVMGSYAYMVVSRCEIQKDSLANAASYLKDEGCTPEEINSVITDFILEIFDIDYDSYLKGDSE